MERLGAAIEIEKAAGRNTGNSPPRQAVTATHSTIGSPAETVKPVRLETPASTATSDATSPHRVDFPYLRSQISMERVLRHLGYFDRLRIRGQQGRGPCPVHGSKRDRGRTFSAHLGKHVFQCFHPPCGAAGNALDLWCAVHHLLPYAGAVHLAQTFGLQLRPAGTEERRGTRTGNP